MQETHRFCSVTRTRKLRKRNEKKARQQEKYRLLYTIIIMLS